MLPAKLAGRGRMGILSRGFPTTSLVPVTWLKSASLPLESEFIQVSNEFIQILFEQFLSSWNGACFVHTSSETDSLQNPVLFIP
jgi:hypothetical protein